jgi:hypothetical protein
MQENTWPSDSYIRLGKDDDRDCSLLYAHFKQSGQQYSGLPTTVYTVPFFAWE